MSIEDRNLKPGTVLEARYKKAQHRCEVVAGEEGKVRYRLKDGREFSSPSAAASAVMGGAAANGWRFWSIAGAEGSKPAPKATRTPEAAKKARSAKKAGTKPKGKGKAKKARQSRKIAGGNNGEPETPAERPTACGDCGAEFPTSREAADHMRDEHGSAEAAGSGGR